MRILTSVAILVLLAGCAGAPKQPAITIDQVSPAPKCQSQRQCEAMWTSVPEALEAVSGMRVRLSTDTRVETFNATGAGRFYGVATKKVQPDGSYLIVASFSCGYAYCAPDELRALDGFNKYVTASGIGY